MFVEYRYILQYPPPIGIDMKLLQDESQRMMNGWRKGGMNKSENVMIDRPPSVVEQEQIYISLHPWQLQ